MKNDVVEFYAWNILKKQLQKYKISNNALYNIIDNVKEQLYSIIANWNEIEFRDSILIIGSEEGAFYEPKNELIANMVVVAIRNSLLEGVSSKSYKEYGSLNYLKDSSIREITSSAIEYFSTIDLEKISPTIKLENDFYKNIAIKYPIAMKALTELSKCTENNREHEYEPIKIKHLYDLEELKSINSNERKTENTESGIDSSFNDSLLNFLKDIKEKKTKVFATDCFKMNTRNFEKTLKILEFILTHDAIFLTSNYLISNNYVSRRKTLFKAAHTTEEFFERIPFLDEITEKNKELLKSIMESIEGINLE